MGDDTSTSNLASLFSGSNALQMIQATPGSALQDEFMQTPAYQLAYGNNTNLDPSQRFASDPGTQLAVQQGTNSLNNALAAHGLSGSGAAAQDMGNYMYGQYNNYLSNQESLFSNYQNQLNALMGVGVSTSGATTANSNAQNLANTTASGTLSTGDNISQLYANQGIYNGNAYLGTSAAQANNLYNGMGFLAQVNQNAIASNNGQQASLFNGLGQANGVSGGTF